MGKSGSELLVYGLIIAGFLLFNYLAQKLAKKAREQQEAAEHEAAEVPPVAQEDTLEDIWGRLPAAPAAAAPLPEQRPAPRGVPPPARPAATRRLFRNRQDLRHAIVLMTVLGPCRAQEPPDPR